jgi:transposase
MKILALDLGKFKSVACEFETEKLKDEYETIRTTPEQLRELLRKRNPDRVVIEICPIAGWVRDLVREMGYELQVASTNDEASRWRKMKKKNDREDGRKLTRKSALGDLKLVHVPERKVRQWRALIVYRQQLVQRRTRIKNHLRSLLEREALRLPSGKKCWTAAGISEMEQWARPMAEVGMEDLWRGELWLELAGLKQVMEQLHQVERKLDRLGKADERVQRVQTIWGVGPRLSEAVVALIDDPQRLQRGKNVGPYVGLTPKQHQSGETERLGRITRHGSKVVRSLLVEASWVGLRYNSYLRAIYLRVKRGSKSRRKIAIVAVARRLLIWCWAMLRDGTTWRPPYRLETYPTGKL